MKIYMKKLFCSIFLIFSFFYVFCEQPIVKNIKTTVKNNQVELSWELPKSPTKKITSFLIYKNNKIISSFEQIENLEPIAQINSNQTSFIDTLTNSNEYFYAVISIIEQPYDLVMISFNSTSLAVKLDLQKKQEIPLLNSQKNNEEKIREIPLPYLPLLETDEEFIDDITFPTKKIELLSPYIFEQDVISPDGGDDYLLFEILKNSFIQKKYAESVKQLERLLGTNIKTETRNRALFYLGESQYFLGEFEKSVMTFVRLKSIYPALSLQWIDSALTFSPL